MSEPPSAPAQVTVTDTVPAVVPRKRLGGEIAIVLGLSLGASAVYSILTIIDRLTQPVALSQQHSSLNNSVTPDRPWLDLAYQLFNIASPVVAVPLVFFLLAQVQPAVARPWHALGFDLRRPGFDLGLGTGMAAVVGAGGLVVYFAARRLGINTQVAAANLTDHWWTVPILVLSAAENAVLEETVMIGYLYRRLGQLGWAPAAIVLFSAVIRGSYHLYQGFGGFAGNLIMGVIFGLVYLKVRRVLPLAITHTWLDVGSFIGYTLLVNHWSLLR